MIPNDTNELYASDIEANDLLPYVDKLWCIVSINIRTDKVYLFHDFPEFDNALVKDPFDNIEYRIPVRTGTFAEGVEFWKRVANSKEGKLVVHNCFGYDKKVLEKFYPNFITPLSGWVDTLVRSKMQWYDRPTPKGSRGTHGLQAWGCRFKVFKPEVNDWKTMDAFKLHRCIEDCRIQKLTYIYLEKERMMLKEKVGIDMTGAYAIDDDYAYHASIQELNGAKIDVPFLENCLIDLDDKIAVAQAEIEPQLPKSLVRPAKIPNSELAKKLSLPNADKVIDRMVERKRNGEIYKSPYKFYSSPSTIFRTTKAKAYSAFHLSYGDTPSFTKIGDLRAYVKDHYPDTVFKYPDKKGTSDWICDCSEQEITTVNKDVAERFGVTENDLSYFGDKGYYTRVDWEDTKLSQQDKVKSFLVSLGWIPDPDDWNVKKDSNKQVVRAETEFDYYYPPKAVNGHRIKIHVKKGQALPTTPKLKESSYDTLPEGLGRMIADYNTYQHRRRFIKNPEDDNKGLLNNLMDNGRCPCGLNVSACSTLRSSQSVWVNAPNPDATYGKQIRSCLIAGEGRKLVGSDMKSAQLSIAAYYSKNWEYFDSIINGSEFLLDSSGEDYKDPITGNKVYLGESGHCVSARAFGVISESDWKQAVKTQDPLLVAKLHTLRGYSKRASFSCLPVDNTYVYAKNSGWVMYKDIYVGMEILAYNPETKLNEFTPIQHIVTFDDKEVIEMSNNEWKFESTPDHRWIKNDNEFVRTDEIKDAILRVCDSAVYNECDQFLDGSTLTKTNKGVRKTFCVTTKFSTFVAKQGDITTITGNCIFGASGKKLASILKVPESEGTAKRNMYLQKVGLERVIEYLQSYIKQYHRCSGGYIPLPMGYWVYCSMPHKLFNYLDQGTEAVSQKLSVNRFNHWLEKETKAGNIDAMKILDIHDEFLVDSHEDCAHEVGAKMCECYEYASNLVYEWHCEHPDLFPNDGVPAFAYNLNGGFAVGDKYLETH